MHSQQRSRLLASRNRLPCPPWASRQKSCANRSTSTVSSTGRLYPRKMAGVEVLIFDSESKLRKEVGSSVNAGNALRGGPAFTTSGEPSAAWLPRSFANTHQTRIKHYQGRGEFLGADTREQARTIYRQVIDEYERRHGIRSSVRQHDGGVRGHGVSDHRCAAPAQGSQKVRALKRFVGLVE